MDLNFSDEDFAFQMEVRNWIKDNYPAEMKARKQRSPGGHLSKEDHVYWQKALNTKGWVAPGWPVEHGGSNFTPSQRYLFDLEMAHADTPAIIPFRVGHGCAGHYEIRHGGAESQIPPRYSRHQCLVVPGLF